MIPKKYWLGLAALAFVIAMWMQTYWPQKYGTNQNLGSEDQNGGGNEQQGGDTLYSAYFTPWWREYYPGPYYGTSYARLMDWPYSEYWRKPYNYNYNNYWRRPQYYNYWRRPYYYRRPVYRPYVRDSIEGRRERKNIYEPNKVRPN